MINPFKSKKGLGRGLSSLIGDSGTNSINNKISISSIIPNRYQPRKNFEKESLEELTNSIRERGIIQPLIVRKAEGQNEKYELIAGERRWQAAQNAGLHDVPVIVIEADNLKSLEFAIVENVQRKDLNPIEEANGYKRLIDEFNYDQEKVSKFIGKSRGHVANCIRLLSLPDEVIKLVEENKLSQGHAKILVSKENALFLAKKIINKKLSVRQSENLVRLLNSKGKVKFKPQDSNIKELENIMTNKIGLSVNIKNNKDNSGQITFSYKNQDQLDHLIDIIKLNY
jgi:ParB family chromosome partitioning protein